MSFTRFAAAAAPALFVLLWSTGFIGARYGLPYIEPMTFLGVRMLFYPPVFFVRQYVFKRYFLNGWAGFISAATGAAAAPSTTSLQRSMIQIIASKMSLSGNATMSSTKR